MLRNSGNDFWKTHIRDASIQLLMGRKVDLDYQDYQPAVVYINGTYFGIKNIRERSNDQYVFSNYGYEDDEIDMIWNWGVVENGTEDAFNYLIDGIRGNKITYDEIEKIVDVNEYINYMILQIYIANSDFPQNNINIWKPRKTNSKWRFILKDTDRSLGYGFPVNHNSLKYNIVEDTFFLRKRILFNGCLKSDKFVKEFYSRFAIYLGDILNEKSTSQVIDSIYSLIKDEYPYHIERWKDAMPDNYDVSIWKNQIERLKDWCKQRNNYVYDHLKMQFELGDLLPLTIKRSIKASSEVLFNGIPLFSNLFSGQFFQGETIQLTLSDNSTKFVWELKAIINGEEVIKYFPAKELIYYIPPECTGITIQLKNSLKIENIDNILPSIWLNEGCLYVNSPYDNSILSVFDIVGNLVFLQRLNTVGYTSVPIISFQRGTYIVKIQAGKINYYEKMIF